MKKFLLIIIAVIVSTACSDQDQEDGGNYQNISSIDVNKIVMLRCYITDVRRPRSEVSLKKHQCASLKGENARIIWSKLSKGSSYIGDFTKLRKTNQDYQVVVEDKHGNKSVIIIVSTHIKSDTRYIGCKDSSSKSWMLEMEEDQVRLLGIK